MKQIILFHRVLLPFFAFIGLMIAVRTVYTGSLLYIFLVWNLFLAWIPMLISSFFENLYLRSKWIQAFVTFSWLIFFPNALYIVTDLVHLQVKSDVPKWFDAVLIFSSSFVGLLMAFVSLFRFEKFLFTLVNRTKASVILFLAVFLGSFGVYLGRFLRWNSWDILSNPVPLFVTIGHRIAYPLEHVQAWGVTAMFTAFFYLIYISIKKLPGAMDRAGG